MTRTCLLLREKIEEVLSIPKTPGNRGQVRIQSPPFRKGGQGGFQRLRHNTDHYVQFLQHLRVGKPEHSQSLTFQRLIAVGVV